MHVICLALQKDSSEQPELQYDEFGFRMDTEGNVFTHMDTHTRTQTHAPFFCPHSQFFHAGKIPESQSIGMLISGHSGYIMCTNWVRVSELWLLNSLLLFYDVFFLLMTTLNGSTVFSASSWLLTDLILAVIFA